MPQLLLVINFVFIGKSKYGLELGKQDKPTHSQIHLLFVHFSFILTCI